MTSLRRCGIVVLGALGVAALTGCSSPPASPATVAVGVQAGEYARAFEAAKDTLRDYSFDLDRVDESSGIITTHARPSSGMATPWIPHTSTAQDTVRGLLERERRTAVVIFHPLKAAASTGAPSESTPAVESVAPRAPGEPDPAIVADPLPDPLAAMTMEVRVDVARVYRPGRRIQANSVRLATFYSDPAMKAQHLEPAFATYERADPSLAANMAEAIRKRLESAIPAPPSGSGASPDEVSSPADSPAR